MNKAILEAITLIKNTTTVLQDIKESIDHVANTYNNKTYEDMAYLYAYGRVSQVVFESYCYLWVNSTPRYSNLLSQYKL